MRSQTYRIKLWNLTCCFILALMFEHDLTEDFNFSKTKITYEFPPSQYESALIDISIPKINTNMKLYFGKRIRWINIPSQIDKCPGQTANFTWEYVIEANEEIRQLQWRLNTTTLIAYRSDKNGLHIDPKYEGRVEKIGDSGILLKNISSKDIGNYTLYPVISWKENTTIKSIWLNVIEVKVQQWCTCERLPLSPEWSAGQSFSIVSDGCNLEINSSFCCVKRPAIECMENDPQRLCLSIRDPINLTDSTTQSRNPNNLTESTTQSRLVPEQTDVRNGDNVLVTANVFLVVHTIMLCFLCTCGLFWILKEIRQELHRRKGYKRKGSCQQLLPEQYRLKMYQGNDSCQQLLYWNKRQS